MHFETLEVVNLRGVTRTVTGMKPMTLLTGRNGTGKTTLLNAARLLLGIPMRNGEKRRPWAECIGPDGATATVLGMLKHNEHEHELRLDISKTAGAFHIDGVRQAKGEGLPLLLRDMGLVHDDIMAAADPLSTLTTTLPELLAAMSGGCKRDELAAWCGDNWTWFEKWLTSHRMSVPSTSAQFDAVGKAMEAERTDVNRERKNLIEVMKSMGKPERPVSPKGAPLDWSHRQQIADAVADLERRRDDVMKQLGVMQQYAQNKELIAGLRGELKGISFPTEDQIAKARAAVLEFERLEKLMSDERAIAAKLEACATRSCQTCGQTIEADPDLVAKLESDLDDARNAVDALDADAITAAKAAADKVQAEYHDAVGRSESIKSRIAALEKELPAEYVDPADLEVACRQLAERIERGRETITALDNLNIHARNESRVAEIKALSGMLGWGVSAFRDGDAARDLLADGRTVVLERMKAVCAPLNMGVRIVGFTVQACVGGSAWRDVADMSTGEFTLMQGAVCAAFGGLGCVDNVDALDSWNKAAFMKVARAHDGLGWLLAGAWGNGRDKAMAEKLAAALDATVVWME